MSTVLHLSVVTPGARPTVDDLRPYLTCSVEVAGAALGIGRGAAYAAARRGEIPTLALGRSLRVPVPKLLELVGLKNTNGTSATDVPLVDVRALDQESTGDPQHAAHTR